MDTHIRTYRYNYGHCFAVALCQGDVVLRQKTYCRFDKDGQPLSEAAKRRFDRLVARFKARAIVNA
jgi:hypothetical protein